MDFFDYLNQNQEDPNEKDKSRTSSILGTWTIEFKIKADVGDYGLSGFLTMYAMCDDQLSGNSCSLPDCIEYDSNVCTRTTNNTESCHLMNETLVDWSDAMIFMYLEIKFDIGYPYNEHHVYTTGGWIGPYPVILARDPSTQINNETYFDDDAQERIILDIYELKFLYGQSTPQLKQNQDDTLFSNYNEFRDYLGDRAVNYTTTCQASGLSFEEIFDPFYKTCENGSVEPVLPYASFTFTSLNTSDTKEEILAKFDYKLLMYPKKGSALYNAFPTLQNKGFPVSGPYCFDGDPNRGWTIDLGYDSTAANNPATLHHSCVEGIPCIPPASEDCNCSMAQDENFIFDPTKSNSNNDRELDIEIYFLIAVIILSIVTFASCGFNVYQRRRYKKLAKEVQEVEDGEEILERINSGSELDETEDKENDLLQPLVSVSQEDQNNQEVITEEVKGREEGDLL